MDKFVITDFVSLFIAHNARDKVMRFIDRESTALIITVRGRIRFSFDCGEVVSDPEHAVLLPEGLSYLNECLDDAESYVFNFHTSTPQKPMTIDFSDHALACKHYNDIISRIPFSSISDRCAIMESMYALAKGIFYSESGVRLHPIIKGAVSFMQQNLACAALTVEDVARSLNISEIYLRKLFEKHLGVTPFKKLTELRMSRAKLLIEDGQGLKQVCGGVGYTDVFQFSRAYKRYFGHSPSSDRRSL